MKSMKLFALSTALFLSFTACSDDGDNGVGASENARYTDLSATTVQQDLTSFTKIFDVSPLYEKGHLPLSVDAGGVSGLEAMASSLDMKGKYLVYCHGDAPSIAGAKALVAAGIDSVYRLEGNYPAWDAIAYVDIAAAESKRAIDAMEFGAIFDVSPYYASGHLPGAADAGNGMLASKIASLDKGAKYLVYCHGDGPSRAGAQLMEDAGFTKVYRLEGNYGAWTGAGYSVER